VANWLEDKSFPCPHEDYCQSKLLFFFSFRLFLLRKAKKNKSSTTARFSTTCVAERMPRKKESFCSFTNQKMTIFFHLSLLDSHVLLFQLHGRAGDNLFLKKQMNNQKQKRNTASQCFVRGNLSGTTLLNYCDLKVWTPEMLVKV